MGKSQWGLQALKKVNQHLLKAALHKRKGVTLDIDATEFISQKVEAKWTYNKNQGYMPMVGHIPNPQIELNVSKNLSKSKKMIQDPNNH